VATSPVTQTLTVTTLSDSGPGSLRTAIQTADSTPGTTTIIDFAVAGVISLATDLPVVSNVVTIDGRSASGYSNGGPPVLEIDCNGQGGLRFASGSEGSQLLAVAVDDAAGDGVTLDAGSVTIDGSYVGLALDGSPFGNHGDGVHIGPTSSGDVIGMNPSGDSGVVANIISGNSGNGIGLVGSSADTIVGNRIGTNPAGTAAVSNGGDGIALSSGSIGNEIGGTEYTDTSTGQVNNPTGSKGQVPPVFVAPPLGNLISGNNGNGVSITGNSRNNVLNGNFVGTTANGDGALGNGADGVVIDGSDGNSLIGCQFSNEPFVYYNVIDANGQNGLAVIDSNGVTIQANFFGAGADNTTLLGNRLDGVVVSGSSSNTQLGGVIPLGNVEAGNGTNGIEVTGAVNGFTTFNSFAGLLAFKGAAPNGNDGLLITATGGNNLVRTNVLSGNAHNGIEIGGDASGVTVDPNIAGMNTNGQLPLPNGGDGLVIDGTAHDNVIGGTLASVIPENTFSANGGYGVAFVGGSYGNRLFGADIGTTVTGRIAAGNGLGGVLIGDTSSGNVIGDASANPSNLISGNTANGVTLTTGTAINQVVNNYIGLDAVGGSMANQGLPIVDTGTGNAFEGNSVYPPGVQKPPTVAMAIERGAEGYLVARADGLITTFGVARSFGSMASQPLNAPIVGMALTSDGGGYWLVAADGGVFCFGDAGFYGSAGSIHLNQPVVGMAATPDNGGYWLVAADGGVFAYGDAGFFGSMGGQPLNRPVVGIGASLGGAGYYLVAADGGIFSFGDAAFHGSMGGQPLNKPVTGLALDRATGGYWEVAADGGIFAFDAPFLGSTGSLLLNKPVVGMSALPTGAGYSLVAADGGIFTFGDAPFFGSTA
jgi:hypothetical protein